jgi:hypothetical protein
VHHSIISSKKVNAEAGTAGQKTRVTARIFALAVDKKPASLAHGLEGATYFE